MSHERPLADEPLIPRTLAGWPHGFVYTPRIVASVPTTPALVYAKQHHRSRRSHRETST